MNFEDLLPILKWGGVALGGFGLLALVAKWARRWIRSDDEPQSLDAPVFTLQDLREMRARGDLSDDEFDRMRNAILGAYADAQDELELLEEESSQS
jgi:hypothetical protein